MDAEQSQETMMRLSDVGDPMKPLRDLVAAQRNALSGDPDGIYAPEFGPF